MPTNSASMSCASFSDAAGDRGAAGGSARAATAAVQSRTTNEMADQCRFETMNFSVLPR